MPDDFPVIADPCQAFRPGTPPLAGHSSLEETAMAEKKGRGSATAQRANAKAGKEGKSNPRKSSAAQSELGKKGARAKKG
ncbi:hypothetical protein ACWPM1_11400 [Tsuneonella sp. HG249]